MEAKRMSNRKNALLGALLASVLIFSSLAESKSKISGTVTYYTSMPEANVTLLIEKFKKAQPNVDINLYRAGTGTVLAKLDAEIKGGNVVADAVSVAEPDASIILKQQGQLFKFKPAGAWKIPALHKDKDGYFYSFGVTQMVIVYNTIKVKEKPKGFADLLKPEYQGKVVLGHVASSGAMAHMVGTMLHNGFGWDYFENLKKNDAILVKGPSDAAQKVATGEALIGITQDATARDMKLNGSPVAYVFPAEGTVVKNTNIQIMKSSKNKRAAVAWVEFLLSAQTQQYLAEESILIPVLPGVKLPSTIENPQIKLMKLNDEMIAKQSPDIKRKFAEIFSGTK
jgi:iron(III) transport system substrate-binding protein